MSVFNDYGDYYDLLYQDKDYRAEVDYVHELIQKHKPEARTILELGSGTGRHALLLAERGYSITGIERSESMLHKAVNRLQDYSGQPTVNFIQSDIRDFALDQKFDVIISLFHVMSYQTSNADLDAVFNCVSRHLAPGGIFIFDCWYGPGVLTDPPQTRIKRVETDEFSLIRLAEPTMNVNANTVRVDYELIVTSKMDASVKRFTESHLMRYLFQPEVEILGQMKRLIIEENLEWLEYTLPSRNSWATCFVLKGIN